MGFKNSVAYVQRKMDAWLRPHRSFYKIYIDDLTVWSLTLENHLQHLATLLKLFIEKGVVLSLIKTFLGYSIVTLLGQRVDAYGVSTVSEKIEALSKLTFPITLKSLKRYIGLTNFLRIMYLGTLN